MNADIRRKLEMLKSAHLCFLEFALTLPRAVAAHAALVLAITALEAAACTQAGGRGHAAGGVDLRESRARELRAFLKDLNRTARTFDNAVAIRPKFRLPASGSYPALIVTARVIHAEAAKLSDSFIEAGLPEDFLEELNALIEAFESATQQKIDGNSKKVRSTAALKMHAASGLFAATKLDAYMRNAYRRNPEILAAWAQARHIQRAPRRKKSESLATQSVEPFGTATSLSPESAESISTVQSSTACSRHVRPGNPQAGLAGENLPLGG